MCLTLRYPLATPVDVQQHLRSVFMLSQQGAGVRLYSKDVHPHKLAPRLPPDTRMYEPSLGGGQSSQALNGDGIGGETLEYASLFFVLPR